MDDILKRLSAVEAFVADIRAGVGATTATLPHLASKADLNGLATKADLDGIATKADFAVLATKADIQSVMKSVEITLAKWTVGTGVAVISALTALVRCSA